MTSSGSASAVSGCVGEILDSRDVAGGDDGVVAGGEDRFGEGAAEAGRAAGDEPGGHCRCFLLEDVDDVVLQRLGLCAEDRLDAVADLDDTCGSETFRRA